MSEKDDARRAGRDEPHAGVRREHAGWSCPIIEGMGYWAVNPKRVGQFKPIPGRHEFGDVSERMPASRADARGTEHGAQRYMQTLHPHERFVCGASRRAASCWRWSSSRWPGSPATPPISCCRRTPPATTASTS